MIDKSNNLNLCDMVTFALHSRLDAMHSYKMIFDVLDAELSEVAQKYNLKFVRRGNTLRLKTKEWFSCTIVTVRLNKLGIRISSLYHIGAFYHTELETVKGIISARVTNFLVDEL
jgi:hypothetical protein